MVTAESNKITFRFPEVHKDATFTVEFQRTLRIPDDNREYPLPPGLGKFPLFHVEDYAKKLPAQWSSRGGVFLPMYQAEALWLNFSGDYPFAVKVAAGKINAVTGKQWQNEINPSPQDYLVIPDQLWLDGFCVRKGFVRQFVAMPLGQGYTAEEQITGDAEFGGIQIVAYPMKSERWEKILEQRRERSLDMPRFIRSPSPNYCVSESSSSAMGLAPGGLMKQNIYDDEYGLEAWDTSISSRCFTHLVNTEQFTKITGATSPSRPLNASDYTKSGLPWFDLYDEGKQAVRGSQDLADLHSVGAMQGQKGENILGDDSPIADQKIKTIIHSESATVKDGSW
jgi:hypothetical protein